MTSQLTRIIVCFLVVASITLFQTSSSAQSAKDDSINYQIIERKDELRSHMNLQQRVALLAIEEKIEQAESDIKSGNYLLQSKPSALNPDRNMREVYERGEARIESGEAALLEARKELVVLLEACDALLQQKLTLAAEKFNTSLSTKTFSEALESAQEVLQATWEQGYRTIFFDELFLFSDSETKRLNSAQSEQAYNAFVRTDGDHRAIGAPSGLELSVPDNSNATAKFVYDNAKSYGVGKKALVTIEIITSEYEQALLSMRTIDLETFEVISQNLSLISDYPHREHEHEDEDEDDAAAPQEEKSEEVAEIEASDNFPDLIKIRDENTWIDRFAQLQNPYQFEVIDSELDSTRFANLAKIVFEDSLLRNSELVLIDSDFVFRAYGKDLEEPLRMANASLHLIPQETGDIKITAQASNSDNIIEIGSMQF